MGSVAEILVRLADLPEFRLFVFELRTLEDEMRVAADPFAERLGRALDRFVDDPDQADGE